MHLHQRRFRRIYLSTNPSPHDPQNLLLAQTNRPMKTPGRIFSIIPSCQSDSSLSASNNSPEVQISKDFARKIIYFSSILQFKIMLWVLKITI